MRRQGYPANYWQETRLYSFLRTVFLVNPLRSSISESSNNLAIFLEKNAQNSTAIASIEPLKETHKAGRLDQKLLYIESQYFYRGPKAGINEVILKVSQKDRYPVPVFDTMQ